MPFRLNTIKRLRSTRAKTLTNTAAICGIFYLLLFMEHEMFMRWVKVHIYVAVLPVTGLIVTTMMSSLRLHVGGINRSIEKVQQRQRCHFFAHYI